MRELELTHPLDLLRFRLGQRRRCGRRGRRSVRRRRTTGGRRARPKDRRRRSSPVVVNHIGHYGLPQNLCLFASEKSDPTIWCFRSRVMFLGSLGISRHDFEAQIGESAHLLILHFGHSHALLTNKRLSLGIYASFLTLPSSRLHNDGLV